ncbi:MAG: fumarylacetoacetate hydrolase family protein [Bacteroidales bacterium]|nr:fumarylacetoacetate hydrolase family protein [Bacteroidales bacterium]
MKIICIGRNYREHARELSNPVPEDPIFFFKPDTSILRRNRPFVYPDFSRDIHYETEIVVKVCRNGKNIGASQAGTYYESIGVGIDFTARDLQQKAKEKGLPWALAKGFDQAAALSPFLPKAILPRVNDLNFHLDLNGNTVQRGCTADMIFSIDELISYLSKFMTLRKGDLLFTGTPAGIGPVRKGDLLEAFIEDRRMLWCEVK